LYTLLKRPPDLFVSYFDRLLALLRRHRGLIAHAWKRIIFTSEIPRA
jgi:hypothetical protein